MESSQLGHLFLYVSEKGGPYATFYFNNYMHKLSKYALDYELIW